MSELNYTHADYEKAMEWLTKMESIATLGTIDEEQAVLRILRSLPEPTPITFVDIPTDKWAEHWGSAVENRQHGWKGWALGTDSDGAIVVLIEENGLPTLWWWPENTTILPDEPRLHIPGITPEPTPDHPATLTTEEDYQDAPAGTVVASGDSPERVWIRFAEGADGPNP
ncbi:hypothetical protein [uncultured Corynebacterium sp.]|uniref:hypothetical protein n=1 Tax=uncultured Corynebacterium sp. TaxID=159447 RepID=UPI0025976B4A|nr:hypothetical protein [uncultured Corynebacterium sp.]